MKHVKDWGDCVTVAELIEQLKQLPEYAGVLVEGCDCYGSASHAELDGDTVVIRRS